MQIKQRKVEQSRSQSFVFVFSFMKKELTFLTTYSWLPLTSYWLGLLAWREPEKGLLTGHISRPLIGVLLPSRKGGKDVWKMTDMVSCNALNFFLYIMVEKWKNQKGNNNIIKGKNRATLVAQTGKSLPAVREIHVPSPSGEDSLQKETATYSSILAWKIQWMEEPGRLYSPWSRKESEMTEWLDFHFQS